MRGFSTGGLRVAAAGMLGWLSRYYAGKCSRNKKLVVLCKYNTPSVTEWEDRKNCSWDVSGQLSARNECSWNSSHVLRIRAYVVLTILYVGGTASSLFLGVSRCTVLPACDLTRCLIRPWRSERLRHDGAPAPAPALPEATVPATMTTAASLPMPTRSPLAWWRFKNQRLLGYGSLLRI